MSDYTSTYTESTGDTIDTADFSTEFDAIETAVATKCDSSGGTLTGGTVTGSAIVNSTIDGVDVRDTVGFFAHLNGGGTYSYTTGNNVKLDAETYDLGNDFNTTTYAFTVPTTGYYLASFGISHRETTVVSFAVHLLGSTSGNLLDTDTMGSASNTGKSVTNSGVVHLTASETVSLRCNRSTTIDAGGVASQATFLNIVPILVG